MRAGWSICAVLLAVPQGAAVAQAPLPSVIRPDSTFSGVQESVQLGRDGHYHVQAMVNGTPLPMLFDTGASAVVLRAEDAARVGIDPASLVYSRVSDTANGQTRSAPVVLASLTIGGITRRNVAAAVSQPGRLSHNLLGQSFLSRLSGYRQEGNRLVFLDAR